MLKAFFEGRGDEGQFIRLQGQQTTNSILRIGEGSSVLVIRVVVPHLTTGKFDVGWV